MKIILVFLQNMSRTRGSNFRRKVTVDINHYCIAHASYTLYIRALDMFAFSRNYTYIMQLIKSVSKSFSGKTLLLFPHKFTWLFTLFIPTFREGI